MSALGLLTVEDAAREFAKSVLHLWDAPQVVREFLETGDESLRAAAWDAARDAAAAAWDAARDASWDAARAAEAAARVVARVVARAAVRDAAWDAQKDLFLRMVDEAFSAVDGVKP